MKDGYNRVEVKGKEMFYMEAVVKDMNVVEDRTAMETLFSYLDKGIDDMGLLLGPVRQDKYEYLNLYRKDI